MENKWFHEDKWIIKSKYVRKVEFWIVQGIVSQDFYVLDGQPTGTYKFEIGITGFGTTYRGWKLTGIKSWQEAQEIMERILYVIADNVLTNLGC